MMELSDHPTEVVDEVITEVRAIKRDISGRHNNDIDCLIASQIAQEQAAGITTEKQAVGVQPPPRSPTSFPPLPNGGATT